MLGSFRVQYAGEIIDSLGSARLQLLLARLLLAESMPLSRQHLAFLFWPDSAEAQAKTNLRNLLHLFRGALPDADEYLNVDGNSVSWRADSSYSLDVDGFLESLQQANSAKDTEEGIRLFQQAVKAYRGELLPGFYEDWILAKREQLRESLRDALQQLTQRLEDRHDYVGAIQIVSRSIELDPLDESAYRTSMRLHALNQDRSGALRVYHVCANTLKRELSVEPAEATRQAYERLLKLDETSLTPPQTEVAPSVLVGRQQEWGQLLKCWKDATKGNPMCAVISGDPGIGKTRLADELRQWLRRQGILVASAECYPAEGELPYAPLTGWLRNEHVTADAAGIDTVWQQEIERLLPGSARRPAKTKETTSGDEKWHRQHLFEAAARILLGTNSPRLLLIDDLQWCEQETLDFLHFLLRFDNHAPLLILTTARLEEIDAGHPVDELLTSLRARSQLVEIHLFGLSQEDSNNLAINTLRDGFTAELGQNLYAETEGNPLFLIETIRSDYSPDRADSPQQPGTHGTIQAVITQRLNQLTPPAREIADLGAVIGREFSYEILKRASDLEQNDLIRGLDELWRRGIVREKESGGYDFSHIKLRQTAHDELSETRRRFYHGQIAQALEKLSIENDREQSSVIAEHYELAGESESAIRYYMEAARAAKRVYANRKGISYCKRALQLLPGTQAEIRTEQMPATADLLELLGDLHARIGESQNAEAAYSQSLDFVPPVETIIRSRLRRKLANTAIGQHEYQRAAESFLEAENELGREPPETDFTWWQAWLDIQLDRLVMLYDQARLKEMQPLVDRVRPVVDRLGSQEHRAGFYHNLVRVNLRSDRYLIKPETLEYSRAALQAGLELGDLESVRLGKFGFGFTSLWHGDYQIAEKYLSDALQDAARIGDPESQMLGHTYLAVAQRFLDDPQACLAEAKTALRFAEAGGLESYVASAKANIAWTRWRDGDTQSSKILCQDALSLWSGTYPFKWLGLWILIDIHLRQGRIGQIIEFVSELAKPSQMALPESIQVSLDRAIREFQFHQEKQALACMDDALRLAKDTGYL